MIKRFPDGTAKPFLTPHEYAQLRDDDRFLYNEGPPPSARITGDKDRENPVEGAPYGEGLIGRIDDLEAKLRATAIEAHRMRSCLQYIEGVGYVDHQSGNANFEYLQGLARSALDNPHTAPSGDVERYRRTAIDVAASLAAAISLLEKGGKAAKKAAASDRMFDQMLTDYRASLDRARAAIVAPLECQTVHIGSYGRVEL